MYKYIDEIVSFPSSIVWELPLKTISEANSSEHWTAKSKRHRQQQFFIRSLFAKESRQITVPCTIYMVRLSPRFLDDETCVRHLSGFVMKFPNAYYQKKEKHT